MRSKMIVLCGLWLCGMQTTGWADEKHWYDAMTLSGDLRYRFENLQEQPAADRDRQSIRARLNLEAAPAEGWRTVFRLGTGAANPISSEQTLGDDFTRKPIALDLAFLEYDGFPVKGSLSGGKMENPFMTAGKSQLLWDADLNPEGIAGKMEQDLPGDVKLMLRGGGFWIQEKAANLDPMLYGAQAAAGWKTPAMLMTAGFGYFYYTEIANQYAYDYAAANTTTAKAYGNTLVDGKYANNYMLGEGFIEVVAQVFDMPLKAYADYVLNHGARESNRGYLLGVNLGRAKAPGTWEAGYNFRWLEKDAVVAAFCDSSFLGGGTDGSGHNFTAVYTLAGSVKAGVTYFLCSKNMADPRYYRRLQLDLAVGF